MFMKQHLRPAKNPIYENYKVYSPDDILMYRTNRKKIDWYLSRDLAEQISDDSIRLTFKPKGTGHANKEYFTSFHENKCVICGTSDKLTRHHVVPYGFRKFLPEKLKSHNHHDILVACIKCHDEYENYAIRFKQQLAHKYGVYREYEVIGQENRVRNKAIEVALTLLKWGDVIPEEGLIALKAKISKYLGHDITPEDIIYVANLEKDKPTLVHQAQLIMNKIEDQQDFIEMWRAHFIETMKPQYLPKGWDVKYRFDY